MAFIKTARIPLTTIVKGSYTADGLAFTKVAGSKQASNYESNPARLDVKAMVELVAEDYNLSDNPSDYIFEAARAVTAEVPNENGDAFPRSELLRFDHRLHKAVYQTFVLKPHHINHRADNPKTARGFVVDASYNDLSEPLPECPGCGHRTASVEGRDHTGVNCIKCGHVVKDEFVELLIAIDTKKDPTFANGVKSGALNSLSMGCEAGYTDCSICGNRARSVAQFCKHIKSGNKKKIFKTASGPKMSFEKCGDVIFTEISRVDQPADPTARQKEILTSISAMPSGEAFVTRASAVYNALKRGASIIEAQMGEVDSIMEKLEEIKATHPELYNELKQMLDPSAGGVPERITIDDYAKKREQDVDGNITPAEMGIKPEMGGLPVSVANKVASDINAEFETILDKKSVEANTVSAPALKFAKSYRDLEVSVTDKGNVKVFTPKGTLFVVRPKTKPSDAESARKIATQILTEIAENGLVATALKHKAVLAPKIAQVLQFHVEDFAGGREEGDKKGITEGGDNDMDMSLPKPAKNLQDKAEFDHADGVDKPAKEVSKDVQLDHAEKPNAAKEVSEANDMSDLDKHRESAPKSTLEDVVVDHADKQPKKAQLNMPPSPPPPGQAPAADMPVVAADTCDGCKKAMAECACKMAEAELPFDREAAKKYKTRVERLYAARVQKATKDAETKVAEVEKTIGPKLQDKMARALKLAAKRQALNLEFSPLKAKLADTLLTEMDIDSESFYPGMDPVTASHIIEAAVADGALDEFIDSLMQRAAEFMNMNDEALKVIESDVKNLQPVAVQVTAVAARPAAREDIRTAAVQGNLVVAPKPTADERVSSVGGRGNIRAALGGTKVRRHQTTLLNKAE